MVREDKRRNEMKRSIVIKIHSLIDVITNSSTEIYTTTVDDAVDKAWELLNEILKVCGVEAGAEDYFSIEEVPDDWDQILEDYLGTDEFEELFMVERDALADWSAKSAFDTETIVPHLTLENKWKTYLSEDYGQSSLKIIAKDPAVSTENIYVLFHRLFDTEAHYDG